MNGPSGRPPTAAIQAPTTAAPLPAASAPATLPSAHSEGTPQSGVPASSPATPAISLDHASRWYGNVVAVNDITFTLGPGVAGLLGPNGAGKSTLLHLMAGLLRPSAGSVLVAGRPPWRTPGVYRQVGLVPERESVYGYLTGREFVLLNARLQAITDAAGATAKAIDLVELGPAADRRISGYSKGMRQRAKLAAALVHEPAVLLLDEPFNGLDPRQRLHMMELLRSMARAGRTVLFSSHILEEVERVADSVLVIYAGRLAASGGFRSIRRLMTDRPHVFQVRSSDDRRLGSDLLATPAVFGVELGDGRLTVRTSDFGAFTSSVAGMAQAAGISLYELAPTDDSLESVFSYLVRR